jgi:hypothetical protein
MTSKPEGLIRLAAIVSRLRHFAAGPFRQARGLERFGSRLGLRSNNNGERIAQFQAEASKSDTSRISSLM